MNCLVGIDENLVDGLFKDWQIDGTGGHKRALNLSGHA